MHDRSIPASEQPVAEELAALRRELATVHARLDRVARRPRRRSRLARLMPLGIVALLMVLMPLSTLAVNPFVDLTGGPHDGNIDAIFNAGITQGCDPTHYCPTDNVTRQEMASFLARTAGLGANKPIANAARLAATTPTVGGPTYAANEIIRVARTSSNTDINNNTNYVTLASVTIDAPTAGFVMIVGSSRLISGAGGACPCEVGIRLTNGTTTTTPMQGVIQSTAATNDTLSLSPSTTYAVPAGNTTFSIQGERVGGTSPILAFSTINALFTPFGSTTGTTQGEEGEDSK